MKPFDPTTDKEALRARLRRMRPDYNISVERLMKRVDDFISANPGFPKLAIRRQTLERFMHGKEITDLQSLATIWAYFQSEPVHERIIAVAEPGAAAAGVQALPAAGGAAGLAGYFTASGPPSPVDERFCGYYALYRRDWEDPARIYRSIIAVKLEGGNVVFEQFTNAPGGPEGGLVYYQAHEGVLFARGSFLHFLMREAYGSGVLFGTIDRFTPFREFTEVTCLCGVLCGATHQTLLPETRFMALRIEVGSEPLTGLVAPESVPEEALRYLKQHGFA